MVLFTLKPNLVLADCCSVDVIKGAFGLTFTGFLEISFIDKLLDFAIKNNNKRVLEEIIIYGVEKNRYKVIERIHSLNNKINNFNVKNSISILIDQHQYKIAIKLLEIVDPN